MVRIGLRGLIELEYKALRERVKYGKYRYNNNWTDGSEARTYNMLAVNKDFDYYYKYRINDLDKYILDIAIARIKGKYGDNYMHSKDDVDNAYNEVVIDEVAKLEASMVEFSNKINTRDKVEVNKPPAIGFVDSNNGESFPLMPFMMVVLAVYAAYSMIRYSMGL